MDKRIAITFILGTLTGVGISAFFFAQKETVVNMPGEVKVLTRTEYKTIRDTSSPEIPSMDVPKYPDDPVEDNIGPDSADVSGYEVPAEETQSDKFERAMAGDNDPDTASEDTSAVSPEEAPPEIIPAEVEEPSED